jgi:hypothetical protein
MRLLGYKIPNLSYPKNSADKRKQPQKARLAPQIQQFNLARAREDLRTWKEAVISAESILYPRRWLLARVYRQVVFDAHLSSLVQTRKLMTLGKPYQLVNEKGEEQPDKTALLESQWFRKFLDYTLDSLFYGYSLVELGDIDKNGYTDISRLPDEYVVPEFGILQKTQGDTEGGIRYTGQPYADWCIGIGEPRDLGLFHKAAPLVLWKQNVIGAWSEFAEIFGMPFRMGMTDIQNEELRSNMVEMLREMGGAGWGVFHSEDKISFIETTKTDAYQVYKEFIDLADQQLSKLILGQTGTTDEKAFAGSAKVHQDIAHQYIQADGRFVEFVINDQLLPRMLLHGFPVQGLKFRFNTLEKLSLQEQFDMVKELLPYKHIPDEWIRDRFGIPAEGKVSEAGISKTSESQS